MARGGNLTADEHQKIHWLREMFPDWSVKQIAVAVKRSETCVRRALDAKTIEEHQHNNKVKYNAKKKEEKSVQEQSREEDNKPILASFAQVKGIALDIDKIKHTTEVQGDLLNIVCDYLKDIREIMKKYMEV